MMLDIETKHVAYPADLQFNWEKWQSPASWKQFWTNLCFLDEGGWKLQIASRSLVAGGLAFLFRMFVRLPFENVMIFCAVMFTMFALMQGGFSLSRNLKVAASLYSFTGIAFFMLATLYQFPGLQLLFLTVFTLVLMVSCRLRVLAVMPVGYGCIAVALPGSWQVGVNHLLGLLICFIFTFIAIAIFPGSYRAVSQSLLAKYIKQIRYIFTALISGHQLEGAQLFIYMKQHITLSVLIKRLLSPENHDNCMRGDSCPQRRLFIWLRELSRGMSLLRGYTTVEAELTKAFPDIDHFFNLFSNTLSKLEKGIITGSGFDGSVLAAFQRWESRFKAAEGSMGMASYTFTFAALCRDMQHLLKSSDYEHDLLKHEQSTQFFSRQTKYWEALRFTFAIALSFLIYKVFRIPYGQWIGMFSAFIYIVPQHGLVFQRINKGLAGTALGVALGFLAIELTLTYSYLWAYFFPVAALFFLYLFLLRGDFAVLMVGFAFALMFSLIMSAPEYSRPNLLQALASRMASGLIAGLIIFILEMFTFMNGALINDIKQSVKSIYRHMSQALINYSQRLTGQHPCRFEKDDAIARIIALEGSIRLFCEALEFEIGYNPKMNKTYLNFLNHLHVSCLYIRRLYYVANHSTGLIDQEHNRIIHEVTELLTLAINAAAMPGEQCPLAIEPELSAVLAKEKHSSADPVFHLFAQTILLFADNFDKTQQYTHVLTERSVIFHPGSSAQ